MARQDVITVKVVGPDRARFSGRKTVSSSITVYGATSIDAVMREIETTLPWRTTKTSDRRHKRRL